MSIDGTFLTQTGGTFYNRSGGVITGTGTLVMLGNIPMNQAGRFGASLKIGSGTASMNGGTYDGPVTIGVGAAMAINQGTTLTVNGDLTINGSVAGSGDGRNLLFGGRDLVNNGPFSLGYWPGVTFNGGGVQNLSGTGYFYDGPVNVASGTVLRMGSDYGGMGRVLSVPSGAALDLTHHILTVDSYSQGATGILSATIAGYLPGVSHGQLRTNGTASLNGSLRANFAGGFDPVVDDTFPVVTYNSRSGGFSGLSSSPGVNVTAVYNANSASVRVTGAYTTADIGIAKTAPSIVYAGAPLTYTLSITNTGPRISQPVTVTDQLPAELIFDGASGEGWSCGQANDLLQCARPQLGIGAAPNIVVAMRASSGGLITNSAYITAGTHDLNLANNSSVASTYVITGASLSISKLVNTSQAVIGTPLTYTIRITNDGPEVASTVVVTDELPVGLSSASVNTSGWDCGQSGSTITCAMPSLAIGTAPDITVAGIAGVVSGTLTNSAGVRSSNYDYDASNNVSTAVVDVTPVSVQFASGDYSVSEADGTASIEARLTPTPTLPVTVVYGLAGGTASGSGALADYSLDFAGVTTTLTFNPGQTVLTRTVTLIDDTRYELPKTVLFALTSPSNALLGSPATTTLTILSNDILPSVRFSASSFSVGEDVGSASVAVNLTRASDLTSTVQYTTADGAANAGSDYLSSSGTLTFTPGITRATFTVPVLNDKIAEAVTETVQLSLASPTNANLLTVSPTNLLIVDNDAPPVVQFSHREYGVVEGVAATITATLSTASDVAASVRFTTTNGSAGYSDYVLADVTIEFAPGVTRSMATVSTYGGAVAEADETVLLGLSEPVNATLGSRRSSTLTIVDNDTPDVQFDGVGMSVSENHGVYDVRIELSNASSEPVWVNYRVRGVSAVPDVDYAAERSGTLVFPAGDTSEEIPVTILQDTNDEPDETLRLTLSNPTNARMGTQGTYELTISDDDLPPPPTTDLIAEALEVTQGVQDLNNSVRLVEGKRTYVRFHVRANESGHRTMSRLRVRDALGFEITLDPINTYVDGRKEVQVNPSRSADHAVLFEIPHSWTNGTVTLTGQLNYANLPTEATFANNVISTTVTFESVPQARLILQKIKWVEWGLVPPVCAIGCAWIPTGSQYSPEDSDLDSMESWLRRAFPVGDWRIERRDYTYHNKQDVVKEDGLLLELLYLKMANLALNQDGDGGRTPLTFYYGVAPPQLGIGRHALKSDPVALGYARDDADAIAGHALAELYGREDAPYCWPVIPVIGRYPYPDGRISPSLSGNDAVFGFDVETREIKGPDCSDLMTYCGARWPSDWTYESIMDALQRSTSLQPSMPVLSPSDPSDRLIVVGTINTGTNQVDLQPLFVIPNALDAKPRVPGDYAIVLRDASASQLASYAFTPATISSTMASISELVPYVTGTARVDILGPGGALLKSVSAGENPPTVTITAPTFPDGPGLLIGESITVTWTAGDPDPGDELTYSLSFSPDDGATWRFLASNLVTNTLAISVSNVVSATAGRFRIGASDGMHTVYAVSDPFIVPNRAPSVEILSPADGHTIAISQTLSLRGRANDPDYGTMPNEQVRWESDRDGLLGNGIDLSTASLSPGIHEITLIADDGSSGVASDNIRVTVVTDTSRIPLPMDALQVGPSFISFNLAEGTTSRLLYLSNQSGSTPITWTAAISSTWLELSSTAGATSAMITATLDADSLVPGRYQAAITFSSPDVPGGDVVVQVEANVPLVDPGSIAFAGPTSGLVATTYAFTATVSPITTTLPLTYTWQATGQPTMVRSTGLTDTASFSWSTGGTKAITLTATNAGATVTATQSINISVPPSNIALEGPTSGTVGAANFFTATVSPITATTPISYFWQATGISPAVRIGGLSDTAGFNWSSAGTKFITVTAYNASGVVTGTRTIDINIPPPMEYRVYLPAVLRSYGGGW